MCVFTEVGRISGVFVIGLDVGETCASDVVVTCQTDRTAYFQEIDCFGVFEEILVREYPANRRCGEEAKAFALSESF